MKKILLLAAACIFAAPHLSNARDTAPLLKGKVDISIKQGTFECDLVLTDIPYIEDYLIFVNAGMNIRFLRNLDDTYSFAYERHYNDEHSYEYFGYYLENNKGKFLPMPGLRFNYTGKFPVISDTNTAANSGDWKGNIAFNGYSVRSDGRQSGWYPVLYDVKNDKMYEDVRYDLEITCNDCESIYVNGNKPVSGQSARLKSDKATEIMLYAGNYKWYNEGQTYFLNPDFNETEMRSYGKIVNGFKQFYHEKLKVPYGSDITYINTTPVTKHNGWLWVSYPTIVTIGYGENGLKGVFSKKSSQQFMAHELAHYYFGSYAQFNSELGDMLSESFAEYLALQVSRQLLKDSIYEHSITKKLTQLKNFEPTPIGLVKKDADYKNRELYVYYYAPIIYTAIEKEIGIENMWKWMQTILATKATFTNYEFMENTLKTTLKDDAKLKNIVDKYFKSENSLTNAVATITGK